MPDLFLGVDAGGTKTHAAVMDGSGRILALAAASGGNWERVGLSGTVASLSAAIDEALERSGHHRTQVTAATFALAGIDWPSDAETMAHVVAGFGLGCLPGVMNDALAVLLAGAPEGIGCASVAGTGGKTIGRDHQRTLATLGMSLGEGGGAGQLADATMDAIARAYHGQLAPTALTAAALEAMGYADEAALFEAVARSNAQLPESFAPTAFRLAEAGDAAAIAVVEAVARQHAADVVGIVDRLDFTGVEVPVVCAGGLHTAGSTVFEDAFADGLHRARWALRPLVLDVVPVVGALIDAHERAKGTMSVEQRQLAHASALLVAAEAEIAVEVA